MAIEIVEGHRFATEGSNDGVRFVVRLTEPPLDNAFTDLAAFSGSTFTTFTLPMEVFTLPFTTFPLFPPMFQP